MTSAQREAVRAALILMLAAGCASLPPLDGRTPRELVLGSLQASRELIAEAIESGRVEAAS